LKQSTLYENIHKKFGMKIPPLYIELRDKKIIYNVFTREWKENWKQLALTKPYALFNHNENINWFKVNEIFHFERPEFWNMKNIFVPFAQAGSGELFCFYPKWVNKKQIPVVIIPYEENIAVCISSSFEHFMFRKIIEMMEKSYIDPLDGLNFKNLQTSIRADIKRITEYLSEPMQEVIYEILKRPYTKKTEGDSQNIEMYGSFLDKDEKNELISTHLKFRKLNKTIRLFEIE
jgi:hypothetical protein